MASKEKIRKKDLVKLGCSDDQICSRVLEIFKTHYKYDDKASKLGIFQSFFAAIDDYLDHEIWGSLAQKLKENQHSAESYEFNPKPFQIFGDAQIASNAISQMQAAMTLPIVVDGALMPDAHHGYGLPIGGVLATQGAVIPYAVGVDIGCRMCLSVYDASAEWLNEKKEDFEKILLSNSRFGQDIFEDNNRDDAFFDREEFSQLNLLHRLKDKAFQQIGSSGGGNHFVEFGILTISEKDHELGLDSGEYIALLSHSGSRGFGATIAQHYSRIAKNKRSLPRQLAHLSWLNLDEEAGSEYWLAMNMAGDYASACHHQIHQRIQAALGYEQLLRIENHHNFAWEENGLIVHRKGATPAHEGELGIIPGSMTAPAFVVRGKGHAPALFSASHGAGRRLSRQEAHNSINPKMLKEILANQQVSLLGGGLDEAPQAYKDIFSVMQAQEQLVDRLALFQPKIVRME